MKQTTLSFPSKKSTSIKDEFGTTIKSENSSTSKDIRDENQSPKSSQIGLRRNENQGNNRNSSSKMQVEGVGKKPVSGGARNNKFKHSEHLAELVRSIDLSNHQSFPAKEMTPICFWFVFASQYFPGNIFKENSVEVVVDKMLQKFGRVSVLPALRIHNNALQQHNKKESDQLQNSGDDNISMITKNSKLIEEQITEIINKKLHYLSGSEQTMDNIKQASEYIKDQFETDETEFILQNRQFLHQWHQRLSMEINAKNEPVTEPSLLNVNMHQLPLSNVLSLYQIALSEIKQQNQQKADQLKQRICKQLPEASSSINIECENVIGDSSIKNESENVIGDNGMPELTIKEKEFLSFIELEEQKRKMKVLQDSNNNITEQDITVQQKEEGESQAQKQQQGKSANAKQHENEISCQICNCEESIQHNLIVQCSTCNKSVHQRCYGIEEIPEGDFICQMCLEVGVVAGKSLQCALCPLLGGVLKKTTYTLPKNTQLIKEVNPAYQISQNIKGSDSPSDVWCHMSCALWIPEIYFLQQNCLSDIHGFDDIDKRRLNMTCLICNKKRQGVCAQCSSGKCQASFHSECARVKGIFMEQIDSGAYLLQCEKHRPLELRRQIETTDKAKAEEIVAFCKEYQQFDAAAAKSTEQPPQSQQPIQVQQIEQEDEECINSNSNNNKETPANISNQYPHDQSYLLRVQHFIQKLTHEFIQNNPGFMPPKIIKVRNSVFRQKEVLQQIGFMNAQGNKIFKNIRWQISNGKNLQPMKTVPSIKYQNSDDESYIASDQEKNTPVIKQQQREKQNEKATINATTTYQKRMKPSQLKHLMKKETKANYSESDYDSEPKMSNRKRNKNLSSTKLAKCDRGEKQDVTYESLGITPAEDFDYDSYNKDWCRYCGARFSSNFTRGPWAPRTLCTPHYINCFLQKKLDLSSYKDLPSKPINLEANSELGFIARNRQKYPQYDPALELHQPQKLKKIKKGDQVGFNQEVTRRFNTAQEKVSPTEKRNQDLRNLETIERKKDSQQLKFGSSQTVDSDQDEGDRRDYHIKKRKRISKPQFAASEEENNDDKIQAQKSIDA